MGHKGFLTKETNLEMMLKCSLEGLTLKGTDQPKASTKDRKNRLTLQKFW